MKRGVLNIVLIILFTHLLCLAQEMSEGKVCGHESVSQYISKNLPQSEYYLSNSEKTYKKDITAGLGYRNGEVITLPVIFHIIHNQGSENISDQRVIQSLENLNHGFRNETIFDPETGIDTKIQFCLAQRDGQGNSASGIFRYESNLTDMSLSESAISSIVNLTNYPIEEYINIRIIKKACIGDDCGFSGFAISGNHTKSTGIFVLSNMIGNSNLRDEVLIHEMGHFLGLRHTFNGSCANTDCLTDGDKVCDTPPDNHKGGHPCMIQFNSCNTDEDDTSTNNPYRAVSLGGIGDQPDSEANYMDYSYFSCQSEFTQGQADRMRWFIEKHYQSLLKSKSCYQPCENAVVVSIDSNIEKDSIQIGTQMVFGPISSNTDSISWTLDNEEVSTDNFIWSPNIEGIYEVCLIGYANDVACANDTVCQLINVFCNANAKFDFQLTDSILTFQNCSANYNNLNWELFYGLDIMNTSAEEMDSFALQIPGVYRLCLTASNDSCSNAYCTIIDHAGSGIENCTNEIDDDNDGFIDLYDDDCECNDLAFQAQCDIECEIIPDSFPPIKMKMKWQSEILTRSTEFPLVVNKNGETRVITSQRKQVGEILPGIPDYEYKIRELSSHSGEVLDSFPYVFKNSTRHSISFKIQDELFYFVQDFDSLYKFSATSLIEKIYLERSFPFIPTINDINGDGIPELIVGTTIVNTDNMAVLARGNDNQGCQDASYNECIRGRTIVADFLPNPGLELAAGNIVYDIEISNLFGEVGNSMVAIKAIGDEFDGTTSSADFNGDGNLDVVVLQRNTYEFPGPFSSLAHLIIWDPLTQNIIASTSDNIYGLQPTLIDIDNDCIPEIICKGTDLITILKLDGLGGFSLLNSIAIQDNSFSSMTTVFDLNNDGKIELIFRDEEQICIIDPLSGDILDCQAIKSGTAFEYPVIADIDGDNQAEILISGYLENEEESRLFCFESATEPWAPARSVLNQYSYHPSMINDDMTIPREPQNPAAFYDSDSCSLETCPQVYNYFGSQATYRTQKGCVQFPALDFIVNIIESECSSDSTCIKFIAQNIGSKLLLTNSINAYYGEFISQNPSINYSLDSVQLFFVTGVNGIISNFSDTTSICFPRQQNLDPEFNSEFIFIGVNDNGQGPNLPYESGRVFQECNYLNNYDSIEIYNILPSIDLGPDIIVCISDPVILTAPPYFTSYLWSDFSTDSIYTASDPGTHIVEATDMCGRLYSDTLIISIDSNAIVNIQEEAFTVCSGEEFSLTATNFMDSIYWHPSNVMDCNTCPTINILADTTSVIYAIGYTGDCESIDTITVTVNNPIEDFRFATICDGDSLEYYGDFLFIEGTYEHRIGYCDSTIILELEVEDVITTPISDTICFGDTLLIGLEDFFTEGNYTIILEDQKGCDSIIDLTLEVILTTTTFDTLSICQGDSLELIGEFYTSEIDTSFINSSSIGCDSISYISIRIKDLLEDGEFVYLCDGDSIPLGDKWLNEEGIYSEKFTSINGCDSVFTYEISIIPISNTFDTLFVCEGDSIEIDDLWYFESGEINSNNIAINGCDSISIVRIEVLSSPKLNIDTTMCTGDSIMIAGSWYFSDHFVVDSLQTFKGCDSIINYNVNFDDFVYTIDSISYCIGDSVLHNENYYFSDSIIIDTLDGNNCSEINTIVIYSVPSVEYYFPDTILDLGSSIEFDLPFNSEIYTFSWHPAEIVDDPSGQNILLTPTEETAVIVEITNIITGCSTTSKFDVKLNRESISNEYSNIFSPNNDNINDKWIVDFADHPQNETFIYDRWGNVVGYWKNVPHINWDGTTTLNGSSNGNHLEQGVYIYVMKFVNGDCKVGDVTIIK